MVVEMGGGHRSDSRYFGANVDEGHQLSNSRSAGGPITGTFTPRRPSFDSGRHW